MAIVQELLKWSTYGVYAHHTNTVPEGLGPWMTVDERVKLVSADIIGAKVDEVAIMGTLTNNIHLLMVINTLKHILITLSILMKHTCT